MKKANGSKILRRGLLLLEILAKSNIDKKVQELATEMKTTRPSVYRYLAELVSEGYIANSGNGQYRLGPKVLELATIVQRKLDVRNVSHPYLVQLSEEMDGTLHLAQMMGETVVIVDKIETDRSLPMYSRIGKSVPPHCTGVGKALLAFLPDDEQQSILERLELERYTKNTITDKKKLTKELALIRKRGFSIDNSEHEDGIVCIGAPIFDFNDHVVAAASITDVPRKFEKRLQIYSEKIIMTTHEISNAIGHREPTKESRVNE